MSSSLAMVVFAVFVAVDPGADGQLWTTDDLRLPARDPGPDGIAGTSDDLPGAGALTGVPYLFQGRRFDPESGLYYFRARFYSPELGRFISHDPSGYFDYPHFYQFAASNPLSVTDPTGRFVNFIVGAVIGGGVDLIAQLVINGGDISQVSWGQVAFSAGVGAATSGLGALAGGAGTLAKVAGRALTGIQWAGRGMTAVGIYQAIRAYRCGGNWRQGAALAVSYGAGRLGGALAPSATRGLRNGWERVRGAINARLQGTVQGRPRGPFKDPAPQTYERGKTHKDHIRARALDGEDDPSNIQDLPAETNLRKGAYEGQIVRDKQKYIEMGLDPEHADLVLDPEIESLGNSPPPRPVDPDWFDTLPDGD